jgi:enoyl-[acyl-carrier protein] reductase III
LRDHGVRVHLVNANAARSDTREEVVALARELAGDDGIHVVLHSLAFGSLAPYLKKGDQPAATTRQLAMTCDVMANSLVYWVQELHAADLLPGGSKVFAMTSSGSSRSAPAYGPVSAAKSALEAHVRQLACELAPEGVAVNALRAGVTRTPSFDRIPGSTEYADRMRSANPHRRLTRPQDVAEAIVLLAGTDSSWITGNVIGVDGGELLTA